MDGNVSKVRTEMRFQGREESTTLIVVGNLFLWYIEVNDVRFMISEEEDIALGPGTRFDHSRAFV